MDDDDKITELQNWVDSKNDSIQDMLCTIEDLSDKLLERERTITSLHLEISNLKDEIELYEGMKEGVTIRINDLENKLDVAVSTIKDMFAYYKIHSFNGLTYK